MATFFDYCEHWARKQGLDVPERGTDAYWELYRQWAVAYIYPADGKLSKADRKERQYVDAWERLHKAANLPDFPEPRSVRLENPRVVRGFGDLWIVLADHHTDYLKPPTVVPMAWFDSRQAAGDYISEHFPPYSPANALRETRIKCYGRADRTRKPRKPTPA